MFFIFSIPSYYKYLSDIAYFSSDPSPFGFYFPFSFFFYFLLSLSNFYLYLSPLPRSFKSPLVGVSALNNDIVLSEFELQSRYGFHFRTYKLILSAMD